MAGDLTGVILPKVNASLSLDGNPRWESPDRNRSLKMKSRHVESLSFTWKTKNVTDSQFWGNKHDREQLSYSYTLV